MSNRNIKLYGLIIGIILFSILIMGFTYAYYNASDTKTISGSTCFTIDYTKGQNISNANVLLFDESSIMNNNKITIRNGMAVTSVKAGINSSCQINGYLSLYITSPGLHSSYINGDSIGAFKYVIASYNANTYPNVSIANLSGASFDIVANGSLTSTSKTKLLDIDLPNGTVSSYLIVFYVDGDLAHNNSGNTTFTGTIEGVATQGEVSGT